MQAFEEVVDGTVERRRVNEEFDEWRIRETVSSRKRTKLGKCSRVGGKGQRAWEMAGSTGTSWRVHNNRRNWSCN